MKKETREKQTILQPILMIWLQEGLFLGILQDQEDLDLDMEEEEFLDLVRLPYILQQWELQMILLQ